MICSASISPRSSVRILAERRAKKQRVEDQRRNFFAIRLASSAVMRYHRDSQGCCSPEGITAIAVATEEPSRTMQFIEMTGKTLWRVIDHDDEMLTHEDLRAAGVDDESLVRVNRQGDIELRKTSQWDVIGGLLGNYEQRVRAATEFDWT